MIVSLKVKIIAGVVLASITIGAIWYSNHADNLREEGKQQQVSNDTAAVNKFKIEEKADVKKTDTTIDTKSDDELNSMFDSIPANTSSETTLPTGVERTSNDNGGSGVNQKNEYPTEEGVTEESSEPFELLPEMCPQLIWDNVLGWVPDPGCPE